MSNGKRKKSFPRISVPENATLFAVALAMAFTVWLFAKAGETDITRILVPVMVTPNDDRVAVRISPETIPVTLRYPKDMEAFISSESFHFEVDMSDMRKDLGLGWSTRSFPLSERNMVANIPTPRRIDVLKIGTHQNAVEVSTRWNAQVALVEPDIVGENRLPEGLQLVRPIKISPPEVWIVGNPEAVATLERDEVTSKITVRTAPINVADKKNSLLESVAFELPPGIEVVQPPSKLAEVNVEIQEVQTVREIRGAPLTFSALFPDSVALEYKERTATVTVYGPQSLLRKLTPASFEVTMIRPPEEVPGTTKEVPLEAHWSNAVPADDRAKMTIRSIAPVTIRITYLTKKPL